MCSAVKSMVRFRLPKILKFMLVFLMCIAIVLSPCLLKPVKVQAAMTGTAIVGGAVVVAGILASIGICIWASDADNRKAAASACESIYQDCKSAVDDVITGAAIAGVGVASITVPTATIKSVFNSACTVIPQKLMTFDTSLDMLKTYDMTDWSNVISSDSTCPLTDDYISKYASVQFLGRVKCGDWSSYSDVSTSMPFCNSDGTTLGYILEKDKYSNKFSISINGNIAFPATAMTVPCGNFINLLKITVVSSSYYTLLFPTRGNYDGTYQNYWREFSDVIGSSTAVLPVPAQDVFNPANDKWIADGLSAMNTRIDDVINKLKEKLGDSDGNIPMSIPRGQTVDDDTASQSQSDVLDKDVASTADKDKDIATNKENDTTETKTEDKDKTNTSDSKTTTNPKSMKIPANNLTTKFPFSIPWDLYHAISILKYPSEAPKFTLHFGSATKVIDMSMFDPVATVARWGLSLLFLLGLIVLTDRVIKH